MLLLFKDEFHDNSHTFCKVIYMKCDKNERQQNTAMIMRFLFLCMTEQRKVNAKRKITDEYNKNKYKVNSTKLH